MTESKPMAPKEVVYQCIVELHAAGKIPTREVVVRETGLTMPVVDEQVKRLREEERIDKVVNGVYEPIVTWPDRMVSSSILDDGRAVLEVGDHKMIITGREARKIVQVIGGMLLLFGK